VACPPSGGHPPSGVTAGTSFGPSKSTSPKAMSVGLDFLRFHTKGDMLFYQAVGISHDGAVDAAI